MGFTPFIWELEKTLPNWSFKEKSGIKSPTFKPIASQKKLQSYVGFRKG